MKQPFFYDVTLRDGNQALKKPWNTQEKEVIFNKLIELLCFGSNHCQSAIAEIRIEKCLGKFCWTEYNAHVIKTNNIEILYKGRPEIVFEVK